MIFICRTTVNKHSAPIRHIHASKNPTAYTLPTMRMRIFIPLPRWFSHSHVNEIFFFFVPFLCWLPSISSEPIFDYRPTRFSARTCYVQYAFEIGWVCGFSAWSDQICPICRINIRMTVHFYTLFYVRVCIMFTGTQYRIPLIDSKSLNHTHVVIGASWMVVLFDSLELL